MRIKLGTPEVVGIPCDESVTLYFSVDSYADQLSDSQADRLGMLLAWITSNIPGNISDAMLKYRKEWDEHNYTDMPYLEDCLVELSKGNTSDIQDI